MFSTTHTLKSTFWIYFLQLNETLSPTHGKCISSGHTVFKICAQSCLATFMALQWKGRKKKKLWVWHNGTKAGKTLTEQKRKKKKKRCEASYFSWVVHVCIIYIIWVPIKSTFGIRFKYPYSCVGVDGSLGPAITRMCRVKCQLLCLKYYGQITCI